MALKKFKPTTPGQRFKIISAFDDITTDGTRKKFTGSP
jgi:ribosomal protein L2